MEIFDSARRKRATISCNGEVINLKGETLGFLTDDGKAGDSNEVYLGEVSSAGQVIDASDNILGKVDLGTAEAANASGGHLFTLVRGGDITDALDGYCGRFEDFTYHKLRVAVAYIFFFDGALVDPKRPTKIVNETATTTLSVDSIVVRAAEDGDIAVVAPFNSGNMQRSTTVDLELHEHLTNRTFLVAEAGNHQVGYLLWETSTLGYKHTWYLEQIVVKSDFRRKGIAVALVNHFLGIAKKNGGIKKILSMVQPDNVPSINLHTKLGFKISGTLEFQENDLRVFFTKAL